jgi:hypothetical protein
MSLQTDVKVKVVNYNDSPRAGVIVTVGVPGAAAVSQTQTTDAGGRVLFTNLNADTYSIAISGVASSYLVKNTFVVNPDNIPFENRTFASSTMSGVNILARNQVVLAGTVSGTSLAPNVMVDFTGGIRTSGTTPSFYSPNTNAVILWSGTNIGKQFNNSYYHTTQGLKAVQSTVIKMNI